MPESSMNQAIFEAVAKLSEAQKREVLDFVRSIGQKKQLVGKPGKLLAALRYNISTEDLDAMQKDLDEENRQFFATHKWSQEC